MNGTLQQRYISLAMFFKRMADALSKGDRVEVRGLCSFQVKEYEPYTGRNPRTGKEVAVKPKKLPVFRMGTELRRRVVKK